MNGVDINEGLIIWHSQTLTSDKQKGTAARQKAAKKKKNESCKFIKLMQTTLNDLLIKQSNSTLQVIAKSHYRMNVWLLFLVYSHSMWRALISLTFGWLIHSVNFKLFGICCINNLESELISHSKHTIK